MNPQTIGPVSNHIRDRLVARLHECRVVVWYDPHQVFAALVGALELPTTTVVSAVESALQARREADAAYRNLYDGTEGSHHRCLLIYVPVSADLEADDRRHDPFAGYAACGDTFGVRDSETLESLATQALPTQSLEIGRLFREAQPTLALLDGLQAGTHYPLLKQALGTESLSEAVVTALSASDAGARLTAVPGSLRELARLAGSRIGLPEHQGENWQAFRSRLGVFLLISEGAADLPGGLPAALAHVPHAAASAREQALTICERLRSDVGSREAYIALADAVEQQLHLATTLPTAESLGSRDTFAIQEQRRSWAVVTFALAGDLAQAQDVFDQGQGSIWRKQPDRMAIWSTIQRCLSLLTIATEVEAVTLPKDTRALITAYTADAGLWRLDHAQRRFENALTHCDDPAELDGLIERCRARYREVVERAQTLFQASVKAKGWPAEGAHRQTAIFKRHVEPELAEHRRVAYFLVDSLRYEMGRDLLASLADLGEASLEPFAAVLPTKTPFGMAALMPGADVGFEIRRDGANAVAFVGDSALPTIAERRALLEARYNQRLHEMTLEDLRSRPIVGLRKLLGKADFLVVRSQDIDEVGEGSNLYLARKIMSDVLDDLRVVSVRLGNLGFQTLVFAADHGHMLLPEVAAGDALPTPSGEWALKTRRTFLGQSVASAPGTIRLDAAQLGIAAPITDYVTASGFKTFNAGAGYFHEGLSLQECIVPVVVVRLKHVSFAPGGQTITITYGRDTFTSTIVNVKLKLADASLISSSVTVRVDAYDGSGSKAKVVGRAGECEAQNPQTGEIRLEAGVETAVPVSIDTDFSGRKVEIRVTDPQTGVTHARLELKNGRLE